ncbi:hypothetical protein GA566_28835 [Cupriavidus sp. SW-Y-13]|nr:hypothetical protein [Cupriavidus sp. SW-Y-13]
MVLSPQGAKLPSALIAVPRCVVEPQNLVLSGHEVWGQAFAPAWHQSCHEPLANLALVARPWRLARRPVLTGARAMPTCAA